MKKIETRNNKKDDLVGYIVSEIRNRILNWEYLPGTRLLEKEMSESFGTSRIPLREALRVLEATGFLENKPNKGYSVKNVSIQDSLDLYDVRLALEAHVCEQLAEKDLSPEILDGLRKMWSSETVEKIEDPHDLADLDRRFHESLAEVHGNKALLKQLRDLNDRIDFLRVVDFQNEETLLSSCNEHLDIIQKIADHDIQGARNAVRKNIEHAHKNIKKGISEMLSRTYIN